MVVQLLLFILYGVVTHLAVILPSDALALLSILLLALASLAQPLRRRRPWAIAVIVAVVAVLYLGSGLHLAHRLVYLPALLVNLGLCWLFGHTLRGARIPLVVRIVGLLHGPQDPLNDAIRRYARSVTACWTALFAFNAAACLALALCATPGGWLLAAGISPPVAVPARFWSMFADAGTYLLTGVMFVGEYAVRRRRFPQQPYRNFLDFLRRAVAIGPQLLADLIDERPA
jgi:uncharacterized membrane protein